MKQNYLSLGQAAQKLGIANNTIKRWYAWYEHKDVTTDLVLPKYFYFDKRGTKYFNESDIEIFRTFKKNVGKGGSHYGVMANHRKEIEKGYSRKFKWLQADCGEAAKHGHTLYRWSDGSFTVNDFTPRKNLEITHFAIIPQPKIKED